MRVRAAALLACAAALAAGVVEAAPITLQPNHTVRLPVTGPAASVVVGNPNVVDVAVVDSHNVFAMGRAMGSTDITVVDALGRIIFSGQVDVAAPTAGHIALYRGAQRSDLACDPRCATNGTTAPSAYQGSGSSASSGGGPASSALAAGLVAGALMSAVRPPFALGGSGAGGPR